MKNALRTASDILRSFLLYMPLSRVMDAFCSSSPDFGKSFAVRKLHAGFLLKKSACIRYMQQLEQEYAPEELRCRVDSMLAAADASGEQIPLKDVLFFFSDQMISRFNERFRFAYQYCGIWRSTALELDEDMFIIAKLIQENRRRAITSQKSFNWSYCTEHDNSTISSILSSGEGVSDNHFHLRGSSPYYQFSWVRIMANPARNGFAEMMKKIESNRLFAGIALDRENEGDSLPVLWIKAAAIRLYLALQLPQYSGMQGISFSQSELMRILKSTKLSPDVSYSLQEKIRQVRFFSIRSRQTDYISMNDDGGMFFELYGERFLLTELLRRSLDRWTEGLLFLYLAIKSRFRAELVQCNKLIGFDNFSRYQSRKDMFIELDSESQERLVAATIASVIDGPKLHSLEMRISPAACSKRFPNAAKANIYNIRLTDRAIKKAVAQTALDYQLDRFYYTMHFPKTTETPKPDDGVFCRHAQLREKINQRVEGMLAMQQYAPEVAARVRGIDACSAEIECRPEVFGPAFRRLLNTHSDLELPQYQVTYHVGEHNYDIVDALRAIHEAVLFLGYRSGSRMGHATFLGISAEQFYADKGMSISMPLQNYLDNLVWMHAFILDHLSDVPQAELMLNYIRSKYEAHIRRLYGAASGSVPEIEAYYQAWLLRGDEPELYRNYKTLKKPLSFDSDKICRRLPEMETARRSERIRQIYHDYHFSNTVRRNGRLPVCETVTVQMTEIIGSLQNVMKKMLSQMCISIECNPSSNQLIGPIKNYSQHPISILFDKGLNGKSAQKTQMNVSVNTDDQSVFATSISNEYAYLAYGLEQLLNGQHEQVFHQSEICDWIEQLRRNGNAQSFINWAYVPGKVMQRFLKADPDDQSGRL